MCEVEIEKPDRQEEEKKHKEEDHGAFDTYALSQWVAQACCFIVEFAAPMKDRVNSGNFILFRTCCQRSCSSGEQRFQNEERGAQYQASHWGEANLADLFHLDGAEGQGSRHMDWLSR